MLSRVLYAKKVPLGKAICIVVVFKVEIVLWVTDLDCLSKVSTLKATLKNQSLVLMSGFFELVVGLEALIVAV